MSSLCVKKDRKTLSVIIKEGRFSIPSFYRHRLTYFSSHLTCPLRFAHRNPMFWSRSSLSSVRVEMLSSSRFLCSMRCYNSRRGLEVEDDKQGLLDRTCRMSKSKIDKDTFGKQREERLTLFTHTPSLGFGA